MRRSPCERTIEDERASGAAALGGRASRLVYPVLSRRSGGLSLGVNCFPDAKVCSFDCPYCELAAEPGPVGELPIAELEAALLGFADRGYAAWAPAPVRDLCVSGNGEPTAHPRLGEALGACARARARRPELFGGSALVLITNSTGFLDPAIRELLWRYYREEGLVAWAKLDGGGDELFRLMAGLGRAGDPASGDPAPLGAMDIAKGILAYASRAPVVIQTMLCAVDGRAPGPGDLEDYAGLLSSLVSRGAMIAEVHLYTYARQGPSRRCAALPDDELSAWAARAAAATGLRVRAFGPSAEIRLAAPR